jgi:catechol 2,3-dioxygenase-like lactoylglutathione lyase family enzyme
MIDRLSHVTFYVLDQEEAKRFYVYTLGFELRNDVKMDNGFRWLTVSPPAQKDLEIVLALIEPGMMFDEEEAAALRKLVSSGKFGAGVLGTPDCRRTYEELKAKGVKFRSEPEDQFYGTECIMEDNSGIWFSVTTPK